MTLDPRYRIKRWSTPLSGLWCKNEDVRELEERIADLELQLAKWKDLVPEVEGNTGVCPEALQRAIERREDCIAKLEAALEKIANATGVFGLTVAPSVEAICKAIGDLQAVRQTVKQARLDGARKAMVLAWKLGTKLYNYANSDAAADAALGEEVEGE